MKLFDVIPEGWTTPANRPRYFTVSLVFKDAADEGVVLQLYFRDGDSDLQIAEQLGNARMMLRDGL